MCDRGIGTWRGTEPVDPGRADHFWTGSLAALFGVRVCPPEEQIWAAGLSFCGGNVCRMSSDGSGAGGFLPGGGIFPGGT